jgi:hypothetical protein
LGNGTFGLAADLAAASAAKAANPTASAKPIAKAADRAGDRNAAAGVDGITAFLRGESFNR